MKGVLSPKPTRVLPRVCVFLARTTIHFAVWASVALEHVLPKRASPPGESRKPDYAQSILGSLLTGDNRIGMLGDLSQHYERLFNDLGEVEANKWLKKEVAESALHLVFRWETVKHVFQSIRNLCTYALRPKTVSPKTNDGYLAAVNGLSFGVRHFAVLSLFAIALGSLLVLFHDPSRLVNKVETSTDEPVASDDVASNNREVTHASNQESAQPSRTLPKRNEIVQNRANVRPNMPPTELSLAMLNPDVRKEQEGQAPSQGREPPTVPRKRYRFSMALPAGSRKGLYEVILEDSAGRRVASSIVMSRNGQAVSATFDLERFPANEYRFSVSPKKDEVPSYYPFRIKTKEK
jgi:hypothetical protein